MEEVELRDLETIFAKGWTARKKVSFPPCKGETLSCCFHHRKNTADQATVMK